MRFKKLFLLLTALVSTKLFASELLIKLIKQDKELKKIMPQSGKADAIKKAAEVQKFLEDQSVALNVEKDIKTMEYVFSVSDKICMIDPSAYIAEVLTNSKIRENAELIKQVQQKPNACISKAFKDFDRETLEGNK